ncbi:unnamed protein product, partial [Oppiella nova]
EEISAARELSMEGTTDLSQLVSNVLPQNSNCNTSPVPISRANSMSGQQGGPNPGGLMMNRNNNQQSIASSLPDHYQSAGFDLSAPQPPPQLAQRDIPTPGGLGPIARPRSYSTSTATAASESLLHSYLERNGQLKNNTSSLFGGTSSPLFAPLRESAFGLSPSGGTGSDGTGNSFYNPIDAVLNQTLDDLNLDDIHMDALEKEFQHQQQQHSGGQSTGAQQHNDVGNHVDSLLTDRHRNSLLGSTQPVNIPGARHNIGNTNSSLPSPPIGQSPLTSSLNSGGPPGGGNGGGGGFGMSSPFMHRTNSVGQSSLYDFGGTGGNMSPTTGGNNTTNTSTIVASMMEVQRLREENTLHKATLANYEEKLAQAMNLWKREVEEVTRKEKLAESQRDEVCVTPITMTTINTLLARLMGTGLVLQLLFCGNTLDTNWDKSVVPSIDSSLAADISSTILTVKY